MPTFVLTLSYNSDDEEASTTVESVIQHLIDEPGPLTFTTALIALEDGSTIDLLAPVNGDEPMPEADTRVHAASAYAETREASPEPDPSDVHTTDPQVNKSF